MNGWLHDEESEAVPEVCQSLSLANAPGELAPLLLLYLKHSCRASVATQSVRCLIELRAGVRARNGVVIGLAIVPNELPMSVSSSR